MRPRLNATALRRQTGNLLDHAGLKRWAVRHLLYHPAWLSVLRRANRWRWPHIDLLVILWPPAQDFFDAIQAEIAERYQVLESKDLYANADTYKEFIRQLYAIDYADPRKIALKLDALDRPPLKLRVLCVRIPQPDMVPQDALNRVRCVQVGDMKDAIRAAYRDRIPGYVYDLIIHSTEADHQNRQVRALLDRHTGHDRQS